MSRIKSVFKCQDNYKKHFKNSQCLLTISVGQATHEGEMFSSIVNLINTSFSSCILLIDDSLQRHIIAKKMQITSIKFLLKKVAFGFCVARNIMKILASL